MIAFFLGIVSANSLNQALIYKNLGNMTYQFKNKLSFVYRKSPIMTFLPQNMFGKTVLRNLFIHKSSAPLAKGRTSLEVSDSNLISFKSEVISETTSRYVGAAYLYDNCTVKFTNCLLENCGFDIYEGEVSAFNLQQTTFDCTKCNFIGCYGDKGSIMASDSTIHIFNSNFTGCTAEDTAGAIYAEECTLDLEYSYLVDNYVYQTVGCVYCSQCPSVDIRSANFLYNVANEEASTIQLLDCEKTKITRGYFIRNRLEQEGFVCTFYDCPSIDFVMCSFVQNTMFTDSVASQSVYLRGETNLTAQGCGFDQIINSTIVLETDADQDTPHLIVNNCEKNNDIPRRFGPIIAEHESYLRRIIVDMAKLHSHTFLTVVLVCAPFLLFVVVFSIHKFVSPLF